MPGTRKRFESLALQAIIFLALLTLPSVAIADTVSGAVGNADGGIESAADGGIESATVTGSDVEESADSADQTETVPAGGEAKLSVHGFLTQAWATANFVDVPVGPLPPFGMETGPLGISPTSLESNLGIPEDGTTNYRFLALQFRYEVSARDIFIVQLSSRALGFSPIQQAEDEVELDWGFYERKIGDDTSLKVGRVMIPIGIYNELRDVGTVLPFYRPSHLFYKEGSSASETVDGLTLAHTFFADSDWPLDVTAYGGEWTEIQTSVQALTGDVIAARVRIKDAFGYQFWLSTPWELRIGTGLFTFVPEADVFDTGRRTVTHFSVDANFGRFTIQGEWQGEDAEINLPGLGKFLVSPSQWYVLAGVRATDKFHIWGQLEAAEVASGGNFLVNAPESDLIGYKAREDIGVALDYFFAPNLVLKAEHHWTEETDVNFFVDLPSGLLRQELFTSPNGSYTIVSLSVSF